MPAQARSCEAPLRISAAVIIMAAPRAFLLQWNELVRQTRPLPPTRPGPAAARLILCKSVRHDLRWGGLWGESEPRAHNSVVGGSFPEPTTHTLSNLGISRFAPKGPELAGGAVGAEHLQTNSGMEEISAELPRP